MNDIIKQLCNANELVELYTNPDENHNFEVGYIAACTDTEFLLHSFQENDLDDGYYVSRNDSVFQIRHSTIYLKNMLQFIKPKPDKYDLPKGYWSELDLFQVVLNLCQQERLIAVVRLECDLQFYGKVKEFSNEIVEFEEVDGNGMPDGTTFVRIEDIKLVGFSGLEENRRTKLEANQTR